jgi:hypothetical protein
MLMGYLLKQAFSQIDEKPVMLFVITGLFTYLGMGLVNGPQILVTPLFLTQLGVFAAIVKIDKLPK